MNSVTNKTRLAENRYRDKLKKDEEQIILNNKKYKKQNTNLEKLKKTTTIIIINQKKQKNQLNYKRKNNRN